MDANHPTTIDLGPARLRLRPASPLAWEAQARRCPGPAGLGLALLARRALAWENVVGADGQPAALTPARLAELPAALLDRLLTALCPPWLDADLAAELEALEGYLRARMDFPALDCAACQDQEERGEGVPDCAGCLLPRPPRGVEPALAVHALLRYLPGDGAAWLPVLTAGLEPEAVRRLGLRLALIRGVLEPRPGPPGLAAPAPQW